MKWKLTDPDTLLAAAKMVENDCDAVDFNLGCPQVYNAALTRRGAAPAHFIDCLALLVIWIGRL